MACEVDLLNYMNVSNVSLIFKFLKRCYNNFFKKLFFKNLSHITIAQSKPFHIHRNFFYEIQTCDAFHHCLKHVFLYYNLFILYINIKK
jgi:hypothetical protein